MNKILREDRTLYLLNEQGNENTFFALVQNGRGKSTDDALELAKDIERCVNSHDALVRIAELVQHAAQNRADRDWTQFHLDLSEAAKLAKQVAPLAAAGEQQ